MGALVGGGLLGSVSGLYWLVRREVGSRALEKGWGQGGGRRPRRPIAPGRRSQRAPCPTPPARPPRARPQVALGAIVCFRRTLTRITTFGADRRAHGPSTRLTQRTKACASGAPDLVRVSAGVFGAHADRPLSVRQARSPRVDVWAARGLGAVDGERVDAWLCHARLNGPRATPSITCVYGRRHDCAHCPRLADRPPRASLVRLWPLHDARPGQAPRAPGACPPRTSRTAPQRALRGRATSGSAG